jgi:methylenetetrahydrofolate--tRNA-(uracil-5-)-methyltransferase
LVCSNSFRSDDAANAVGLLHAEMRALGSLILKTADAHRVPAGSALAVDREGYAEAVTQAIAQHPLIELVRERVDALPEDGPVIVATGPLTAASLAGSIGDATGADALAFFDAIAPIVHHHSIDMDVAWMASRWDKGETKDYINCPMDKDQYLAFHQGLLDGEKTEFKEWEKDTPYFDGCMPVEVMAERGVDTLRYGPMKPVGLDNPRTGRWPYAVVQLRQDNALGTLWNIVGFQTKLKHAEQVRLFRTIPGLEKAEFARLGGLHRNTFIQSPKLLDGALRLKSRPNIRFAGQITGCEGYVESAAIGLLAGRFAAAELLGRPMQAPPLTTALGALLEPRHRRRGRNQLPADEREFRAVPAARRRQGRPQAQGRPQGDDGRARRRGAEGVDGRRDRGGLTSLVIPAKAGISGGSCLALVSPLLRSRPPPG